jgi:hypothetical protein
MKKEETAARKNERIRGRKLLRKAKMKGGRKENKRRQRKIKEAKS